MNKTLIAALLSVFSVSAARAGYTVMDDDLFPTRAIPASVAAAAQAAATQMAARPGSSIAAMPTSSSDVYFIPFRKNIYGLNADGITVLRDLLPLMNGSRVVIIGRPDTVPNRFLADQRATYLRNWLIKQNVPADKIEISLSDVPTTPIGNATDTPAGKTVLPLYPVDLRIVGAYPSISPHPIARPIADSTDARTTVENGIRTTMTAAPPQPTSTVAIIATPPESDARLDLVRKIVQASMQGRMDAKVAVFTIGELLATPTAGAQKAVPPTPAAAMGLVAAPETVRPKEWLLSSDKTLKDSASEWARVAGYELDWKASNFYKVQRTRSITTAVLKDICPANTRLVATAPKDKATALGDDALDVIDCVTSVVGLDMNVWKHDKLICIGDANTNQCKARQSH